MKSFTSIFYKIEQLPYVIMRNYEEFSRDSFLEDHPDVDILTSAPEELIRALGLVPRGKLPNPAHYKLVLENRTIKFDIRTPKDGYYDPAWAEDMLKTRIKKDEYFVPDPEVYFYSLLYHALIQKPKLSDDYRTRLLAMAKELSIPLTEKNFYPILESYMKKHSYRYTYPRSLGTMFHIKKADSSLVEKKTLLHMKRSIYQLFFNFIKRIF